MYLLTGPEASQLFPRIDTLSFPVACFCLGLFCIPASVWYHVFLNHSFNVHSFATVSFSVIIHPTQVKSETNTLSNFVSRAGAHERSCLTSDNRQYRRSTSDQQ